MIYRNIATCVSCLSLSGFDEISVVVSESHRKSITMKRMVAEGIHFRGG